MSEPPTLLPRNSQAGHALLEMAYSDHEPDLKEAKALLECNPDFLVSSPQKHNMLVGAIMHHHNDLLLMMLQHGAPINGLKIDSPLLHMACMLSDDTIVRALIAHGADVNATNADDGITALQFAVVMDYTALMENEGENKQFKDDDDMAEEQEWVHTSDVAQKTVQALLNAGTRITAEDIPDYDALTKHRKAAVACIERVLANSPIDVAALTSSDVCFFANMEREDELFADASLWRGKTEALKKLMHDLPPHLRESLLSKHAFLSAELAQPDTRIDSWSAGHPQRLGTTSSRAIEGA